MQHTVILHYTDKIVRDAAIMFWKRSVGVGALVAILLVGVSLAFLWWNGVRSLLFGVLAGAFLVLVMLLTIAYFVHLRSGLARFAKMQSKSAMLTLGIDTFSMASDLGNTTLPWSAIKEIWQSSTFCLLLFSKSQFVTIPLANLTPEHLNVLLERARGAGAQVS